MRKSLVTVLIVAAIIVGVSYGASRLFLNFSKSGKAGLKVISTPQASVFINNEFKSATPYETELSEGIYTVKLIPEGTDQDASTWEGEISLVSGLLTYINRDLGPTDLESAGDVLTLEKIEGERSEISVETEPPGATIALDGEEKGTAPLEIPAVAPGDHLLHVFAPSFNSRQVNVKTTQGYRLNAMIQLALLPGQQEATESAENEEEGTEEKPQVMVRILDTPTGWLRVREGPTTADEEITKVDPGDEYPYLDEENDWYKIDLGDGEEGWVSGQYAEKVDVEN